MHVCYNAINVFIVLTNFDAVLVLEILSLSMIISFFLVLLLLLLLLTSPAPCMCVHQCVYVIGGVGGFAGLREGVCGVRKHPFLSSL